MKKLFIAQALYNRWANAKLAADMAKLSTEQLTAGSDVNFGSILAIANHLVLADRAWLNRFTGQGEPVPSIDAVPYPRLPELAAARSFEEERTIPFARALDPAALTGILAYTAMNGRPMALPLALCIDHFFNHQTHHRGQIHGLIGGCGLKAADLDFIFFERETGTYAKSL
ncbi:MAG: DinB family protein [Acidobacteriota bacterium]